jgi:hypothetical protein
MVRSLVIAASSTILVGSCALIDASGGDDDSVVIGDGDGDFSGCFDRVMGTAATMVDMGSASTNTCGSDTRLDINFACGGENGGDAAIFELFVIDPGLYEICVISPGGVWVPVSNSQCDEQLFRGSCNVFSCATEVLDPGPLLVYWDPSGGDCGTVEVTVRFAEGP